MPVTVGVTKANRDEAGLHHNGERGAFVSCLPYTAASNIQRQDEAVIAAKTSPRRICRVGAFRGTETNRHGIVPVVAYADGSVGPYVLVLLSPDTCHRGSAGACIVILLLLPGRGGNVVLRCPASGSFLVAANLDGVECQSPPGVRLDGSLLRREPGIRWT